MLSRVISGKCGVAQVTLFGAGSMPIQLSYRVAQMIVIFTKQSHDGVVMHQGLELSLILDEGCEN